MNLPQAPSAQPLAGNVRPCHSRCPFPGACDLLGKEVAFLHLYPVPPLWLHLATWLLCVTNLHVILSFCLS